MFTGKRPTDEIFRESFNLHNFIKPSLPDIVLEVADPNLLSEIEESETSIDIADNRLLDFGFI